jgi:hypothetical protein
MTSVGFAVSCSGILVPVFTLWRMSFGRSETLKEKLSVNYPKKDSAALLSYLVQAQANRYANTVALF